MLVSQACTLAAQTAMASFERLPEHVKKNTGKADDAAIESLKLCLHIGIAHLLPLWFYASEILPSFHQLMQTLSMHTPSLLDSSDLNFMPLHSSLVDVDRAPSPSQTGFMFCYVDAGTSGKSNVHHLWESSKRSRTVFSDFFDRFPGVSNTPGEGALSRNDIGAQQDTY
jgi:hypothetical protein